MTSLGRGCDGQGRSTVTGTSLPSGPATAPHRRGRTGWTQKPLRSPALGPHAVTKKSKLAVKELSLVIERFTI